jgi:surface antigen
VRIFGTPRRDLWRARNWLRLGRELTGPRVGAIVVFARGRDGGHVGQIVEVISPNQIRIWSGNDRGQIRESLRSTVGVIGYRDIFGAQ